MKIEIRTEAREDGLFEANIYDQDERPLGSILQRERRNFVVYAFDPDGQETNEVRRHPQDAIGWAVAWVLGVARSAEEMSR